MDATYRNFTLSQVCEQLNLTRRSVHQLVRDGQLECFQITPKKRIFSQDHIATFLRAREKALPGRVDRPSGNKVRSPREGGGKKKSSRGFDRAQLKKELRKCQ